EIVEIELTRSHRWGRMTIGPAFRTFFYHDLASTYRTHSLEGWLYLSYDVGPFRLFSNHSFDLLTHQGGYYGEAGLVAERRVSPRVELGGSLGAGWASSTFNDSYAGVAKSALNRISAEGWLTAHVSPRFYVGPHVEFSTIVDRSVRAGPDI